MKMTVLNANKIMLSNKYPIVPNKDKPLAFLEISGIKIECFHTCSCRFVVYLSVVSQKFNFGQLSGSRRAVIGQSSDNHGAVVKQLLSSRQVIILILSLVY